MALSHQEALELKPGDRLTFGNSPGVFEVTEVQTRNGLPYLVLRRDDGLDTFAHHYELDVAERVTGDPDLSNLESEEEPDEMEGPTGEETPASKPRRGKAK